MVITHNLPGLNAFNKLQRNNKAVSTAVQKLSSGLRINSAADDAAGLAISEKMRAQIRGLNVAQRNAQDGISLIQTAEGGMASIHESLQRMRELCVQGANGTLNDSDRANVQNELDQLKENINSISNNTQFNSINLLNGDYKVSSAIVSATPNLPLPDDNSVVSASLQIGDRNIVFDFEKDNSGVVTITASSNGVILGSKIVGSNTVPEIEWQKTYGGSRGDRAIAIDNTADGGYIFAGETTSPNDGDVSGYHDIGPAFSDQWIVKTDSQGEIQWQKAFGGSANDWATGIKQTSDGGYIISGYTISNDGDVSGQHGPGNTTDFWITKLDSSGTTLLWKKCLGGSGNEAAYDVKLTSDGGFVVSGYASSDDGDVTGYNSANLPGAYQWITKFDSSANIEWKTCLDNKGGAKIYQTSDNGFIVAGDNSNEITKLDASGNVVWEKSVNCTQLYDIRQTNDGGFIVAGGNGDAYVAKLHGDGSLDWEQTYSTAWTARSIKETSDGGFVMTGSAGSDVWVSRIDSNGSLIWENTYGGSLLEDGYDIEITTDGGLIVAGRAQSTDGDITHNNGQIDAWLIKLKGPNSVILDLQDITDGLLTYDFNDAIVTFDTNQMDIITGISLNVNIIDRRGLTLHTGANAGQTIDISLPGMSAEKLGLTGGYPKLTPPDDAQKSIGLLDSAISTVSMERSNMGAIQNRLEHIISNLANSAENLVSAESRIRDADIAREVMEMAKNNILVQAAQAMLAQASNSPQGILQLLK